MFFLATMVCVMVVFLVGIVVVVVKMANCGEGGMKKFEFGRK